MILLSNLICSTHQRAAIACCGMVGGLSLDTSIFPFILRGLSLFGVDSAESILSVKEEVWENLASSWKLENIDENIIIGIFLEILKTRKLETRRI